MSQENVETFKRAVDAIDRRDLEALLPELDPEVEWHLDQVARWAESGPWGRSAKFEAERVLDVDEERVLALVRVTAEGQESGVQVEMRDAHEITIRNGIVHRAKVHPDQGDPLHASPV